MNSRLIKAPEIADLAKRMKNDWDSRIACDYKSWMNDRVQSDEELWATGERDFREITKVIPKEELKGHTALDIGCGVGRLLKPASTIFEKVIGIDVSSEAIAKAKTLLADISTIKFLVGNGANLSEIESESIDFAYSFGVLSNMPVSVAATYLIETHRVLKTGGHASLQIFAGKCQPTIAEDTIAFRSFEQSALEEAFKKLGFAVLASLPLPLEEDVPDDGWLRPFVFSLRKQHQSESNYEDVLATIAPEGEAFAPEDWDGSHTEYLLTVMRAEELAKAGKTEEARKVLEFAVTRYKNPDPKLVEFLKNN